MSVHRHPQAGNGNDGGAGVSGARTAAGLVGFVVLGLSPSFVDWQQSPEKRKQIILFYAVGLALIWFGVFRDR